MKEYEKNISRYIGFGTPISMYKPWDLEKFRFLPLYMGLGTWKNSTPELPSELWDSEKFQALTLNRLIFHARASSQAPGLGKILSSAST